MGSLGSFYVDHLKKVLPTVCSQMIINIEYYFQIISKDHSKQPISYTDWGDMWPTEYYYWKVMVLGHQQTQWTTMIDKFHKNCQ